MERSSVLYNVPESWGYQRDGGILTEGILVIGMMRRGLTDLQPQKLCGFVRLCPYDRKVYVERTTWQPMELFRSERMPAEGPHGIFSKRKERTADTMKNEPKHSQVVSAREAQPFPPSPSDSP